MKGERGKGKVPSSKIQANSKPHITEVHGFDLELGTWNLDLGTWNLDLGTWNLEPGTWNLELGSWNLDLGTTAPRVLCG
ncbi:hypothetical protein BMS3Abin11_00520 [bacterium BMS3Abin11]|nr:hypothetical protein BMS3Abin11_00520 [bacterium BMS3Abin11]